MAPTLRELLLGTDSSAHRRYLFPGLAVVLFVMTFAAYAVGVFHISGGVVFIPGHAALVGVISAGVLGYLRQGLVAAWLVAYTPLLGAHADHAFLGLSSRTFQEQFDYFLHPEGFAVMAVQAIVLGTLAFLVGWLLHLGLHSIRSAVRTDSVE